MNMLIGNKEFHERRSAHAVHHNSHFISCIIDSFCKDLIQKLIRDLIDRTQFFAIYARLAVDTDTDLDLIFCQIKARLARCGNCAGIDGHTHGANICNDLLCDAFYISKRSAGFSAGTCKLMYEDRAGDTAASRRPCTVLNSDVVRNNDLIYFDILITSHIGSHLKVHNIACVVLDYKKNALTAVSSLDCLIDLIRCGGCEDSARNSGIQHSLAYKAAVCRLMSAAAAGYQSDLSLGTACTNKNLQTFKTLNIVRIRSGHAIKHFIDDIVDLVNQFLHDDNSSFIKTCSYGTVSVPPKRLTIRSFHYKCL